jgi:hypothetical protein
MLTLSRCTLQHRTGKLYVKDADGVVALRRDTGEWIDAFGGTFEPHEIGFLNSFARQHLSPKDRQELRVSRVVRKSRGALTRTEARNVLARRYDGTDFLAMREIDGYRRMFEGIVDHHDPARVKRELDELRSWAKSLFWHYGPTSQLWPGDSLVWDPNAPGAPCQSAPGAWVVRRGNG